MSVQTSSSDSDLANKPRTVAKHVEVFTFSDLPKYQVDSRKHNIAAFTVNAVGPFQVRLLISKGDGTVLLIPTRLPPGVYLILVTSSQPQSPGDKRTVQLLAQTEGVPSHAYSTQTVVVPDAPISVVIAQSVLITAVEPQRAAAAPTVSISVTAPVPASVSISVPASVSAPVPAPVSAPVPSDPDSDGSPVRQSKKRRAPE